jgi:hypothetical protein
MMKKVEWLMKTREPREWLSILTTSETGKLSQADHPFRSILSQCVYVCMHEYSAD